MLSCAKVQLRLDCALKTGHLNRFPIHAEDVRVEDLLPPCMTNIDLVAHIVGRSSELLDLSSEPRASRGAALWPRDGNSLTNWDR